MNLPIHDGKPVQSVSPYFGRRPVMLYRPSTSGVLLWLIATAVMGLAFGVVVASVVWSTVMS